MRYRAAVRYFALLVALGSVACGSECLEDSDCESGQICVSRTCQTPGGGPPADAGTKDAELADRPVVREDARSDAGLRDARSDAEPLDAEPADVEEADADPTDVEAADTEATDDAEPADVEGVDASDAEAPDADPADGPDAQSTDVGVSNCVDPIPLAPDGYASGGTSAASDDHAASCFLSGGRDLVYAFDMPGEVYSLAATTRGSGFDTALHIYHDDCTTSGLLSCNDDDFGPTSRVEVSNSPAGRYYVIVDGADGASGGFRMQVSGKLRAGQPCDPNLTYLGCEFSRCTALPSGGFGCPAPKDCEDGFDSDRDGLTDEDAPCLNPPVLTCTGPASVGVDRTASFAGRVADDGSIEARRWTLISSPPGFVGYPAPYAEEVTSMRFTHEGEYVLRYEARDDDANVSVCEMTVSAGPIQCLAAQPIPVDGLVSDTTVGAGDDYQAYGCFDDLAADRMWSLPLPGLMTSLRVDVTASHAVGLHLYRGECSQAYSCRADRQLDLVDVPGGDYYLVVDGIAGTEGPYSMQVSGKLREGQPCDPSSSYVSCETGVCALGATGAYACPSPADCGDGLDNDRDGSTDEDAATCVSPPVVACPAALAVDVNGTANLTASVTDDGVISSHRWEILSAPFGSDARPSPANQRITSFRALLPGVYRLRYSATDDAVQTTSCEVDVEVQIHDDFRVELIWNPDVPEGLDPTDLDLHVLHPLADSWWGTYDCHWTNTGPAWGAVGTGDDPSLDVDDVNGRGPENINIYTPQLVSYRVGVHYFSDDGFGPSRAYVNIYCYGTIAAQFGPVVLEGAAGPTYNDFWKVADVTFDATSCTVTPLLDSLGDPLIVSNVATYESP